MSKDYEEVNENQEMNETEQPEVTKVRFRDRIPKWVKIAGIAGGALLGTVIFGKLVSPDSPEEIEDVPFTETDVSE